MRGKDAAFNLTGYMHNLIEAQQKVPLLSKEERIAIELMRQGITDAYYKLDKALNENIDVVGIKPDETQVKIIALDRDQLTMIFQQANVHMGINDAVHIVEYPDHVCAMVSNHFDGATKVIHNSMKCEQSTMNAQVLKHTEPEMIINGYRVSEKDIDQLFYMGCIVIVLCMTLISIAVFQLIKK